MKKFFYLILLLIILNINCKSNYKIKGKYNIYIMPLYNSLGSDNDEISYDLIKQILNNSLTSWISKRFIQSNFNLITNNKQILNVYNYFDEIKYFKTNSTFISEKILNKTPEFYNLGDLYLMQEFKKRQTNKFNIYILMKYECMTTKVEFDISLYVIPPKEIHKSNNNGILSNKYDIFLKPLKFNFNFDDYYFFENQSQNKQIKNEVYLIKKINKIFDKKLKILSK